VSLHTYAVLVATTVQMVANGRQSHTHEFNGFSGENGLTGYPHDQEK